MYTHWRAELVRQGARHEGRGIRYEVRGMRHEVHTAGMEPCSVSDASAATVYCNYVWAVRSGSPSPPRCSVFLPQKECCVKGCMSNNVS